MNGEITNTVTCGGDPKFKAEWGTNNIEPKYEWYNNADVRIQFTSPDHMYEIGIDEAAQSWKGKLSRRSDGVIL